MIKPNGRKTLTSTPVLLTFKIKSLCSNNSPTFGKKASSFTWGRSIDITVWEVTWEFKCNCGYIGIKAWAEIKVIFKLEAASLATKLPLSSKPHLKSEPSFLKPDQ
jgi:hypothetical protein